MLTFLRKIRRSLIESGSARKYLLYAIGEIALVVVGILIALQINTWNQKRIEKAKSIEYHERLIEDLDYVIKWATDDIKRADGFHQLITASVSILESKTLVETSKQILDEALLTFNEYIPLDGTLPTYDEMKSSGHIGLIYDPEVRRKVARYLAFAETISNIQNVIIEEINDLDFINRHVKIDLEDPDSPTLQYNFDVLASDPLVVNRLSRHAMEWHGKGYWSEGISRTAETLKNDLEESLEKL